MSKPVRDEIYLTSLHFIKAIFIYNKDFNMVSLYI